MTVYKWSATAATNDDVDSTINWQEGQSPASVNNSARAMMAAVAKFRDDMSGNLVTAGTSTAYTLTTNQVFSSLTDGLFVAARMDETNGASPTLNVDSLGAKSIATVYGTAVGAGKLRGGGIYVFVYDSTDDKWIVQGNPNDGFESGTKVLFRQTAAPTGWTKDTTYTDAALRVTSGTISQQATGGKEFSTLFAARTIAEANLPSHTHSFSATTSSNGDHSHTYTSFTAGSGLANGGAFQGGSFSTSTNGAHTHTVSGTTGTGSGSGTAMDFAVNFVDVIIATRD
jgi:hypothetical protein